MHARRRVMQALPYQGIYCLVPATQFSGTRPECVGNSWSMLFGNRVDQVLRYLSSLFTYLTNIVLHEVWYRDVPPCIKMLLHCCIFPGQIKTTSYRRKEIAR
jgi:hypothetical protein